MKIILTYLKQRNIQYAIGAIVLIILGIFYWGSKSAPVEATVVIHKKDFVQDVSIAGKVIAAELSDLGFAQSGRINRVNAKVGQVVSAGTVIASIENGDEYAAVLQKQAALDTQNSKLQSLKNGTRPEEIAVSQSGVASAESALAQTETARFNTMQDSYTAVDNSLRGAVDPILVNPHSSNVTLQYPINDSQLSISIISERVAIESALAKWKADIASNDSSSASALDALSTESRANLQTALTLLADTSVALSSLKDTTSLSQSTIDAMKTAVATARTNVNASISSLTTANTAEKSARAAVNTAKDSLALSKAGSTAEDISAQESQVKLALADLESAQARLQKTLVVAPFSGVVSKIDIKVGEIASPGTSEISLMSRGTFQIETFVPEVTISGVAIGNTATVTLDAYADADFGAKVISIDPAETVKNGVSTYRVKLQFTNTDPRIKSGMTANVRIVTNVIHDAITVPQAAVFLKDGASFVQIKIDNKKSEDRAVTTGVQSAVGDVQILSGLSEGDVVVLNPVH